MKKINTLIGICVLLIFIGIFIGIFKNTFINIDSESYLTSPKDTPSFNYLHNQVNTTNSVSFDFSGFNGRWSLISFDSSKGTKLTISDNTKITKGEFYIVILNSQYKIIATVQPNKEEISNLIIPKNGQYIIRIVGKNASGKFIINSNTNINLYYKDIMGNVSKL
jgi:hypothetical protein